MPHPEKTHSSADSETSGITHTPEHVLGDDGAHYLSATEKTAISAECTDVEEGTAVEASHENIAPDGGVVAWSVLAGVWCVMFCSIGAFQEFYQNNFLSNYSPSTIAWIPSLQLFFQMGMGPIIGALYDNFGPRYLVIGGSFLHVFGLMMASLSTKYYQILLAQGVCSAIGVAAIFQPAINVIHGWFDKKRGAAFGIVATGSSIGGVVFPIMVSRLIREVGYGWAMRICAFLILGLLVVANLTIRANHPPRPQRMTRTQLAKPFRETEYAGMKENLVQYLLPILNAASLFGRIFSGVVGDKIGRYNIFVIVGYLTALLILALWIPCNTQEGIIAFSALYGFSSGAYVSLIGPLIAQISPLPEIGFRTGIIFLFLPSVA
ncbi:unnamed protein product [Parascedosporium putredinis]|uniref:Major facilitator superfamily (MFS) profile domain-containing protein n=1 Tax=Parascedosporium putredinis TaxID=1442378 RepID=A0A9P1H4I8_9PEZI|nr:unnamed protein product [Parascedosporium putredinis]CAI7996810.1 unnamed protein product [Parascedosporium putredinis]